MNNVKFLVMSFLIIAISSCSSLNTPSSTLIDNKPVVKIGDVGNVADDHIVLIPAGTSFPINFSVTGSLFEKSESTTVMVSFKKKLYLYKYWASLDGKIWINSHELINVEPSGGFDKTGGQVELKLNFAK